MLDTTTHDGIPARGQTAPTGPRGPCGPADLEPLLGYLAATARGLIAEGAGRGESADASELVQRTVVTVLVAFARGRGPEGGEAVLKAWLRGVMRNVLREGRRARRSMVALPDDEGLAADTSSVGTKLDRREVVRLMTRAKDEIGERDRILLALRHEEALSFEEMGRRLGVSSVAAHKAYHKAVARLEGAYLKAVATDALRQITRNPTSA